MMAHPKYGFGEVPVASPHPVFGKKPGIFTHIFGTENDKYWPTEGDVNLYKEHMRRLRNGDYGQTKVGGRALPFDPEACGIVGVSQEHASRIRVKDVRDEYRRRLTDNRAWWETD